MMAADQIPDRKGVSGGPTRILVVDDSHTIRELLRKTLALYSYQVVEATDGLDALAILKNDRDFALLIVDLMMPRLDGLSLVRQIREDPSQPRYPVLILTGEDIDFGSGLPEGASALLAKPFAPSVLLSTIRELIEKSEE